MLLERDDVGVYLCGVFVGPFPNCRVFHHTPGTDRFGTQVVGFFRGPYSWCIYVECYKPQQLLTGGVNPAVVSL